MLQRNVWSYSFYHNVLKCHNLAIIVNLKSIEHSCFSFFVNIFSFHSPFFRFYFILIFIFFIPALPLNDLYFNVLHFLFECTFLPRFISCRPALLFPWYLPCVLGCFFNRWEQTVTDRLMMIPYYSGSLLPRVSDAPLAIRNVSLANKQSHTPHAAFFVTHLLSAPSRSRLQPFIRLNSFLIQSKYCFLSVPSDQGL